MKAAACEIISGRLPKAPIKSLKSLLKELSFISFLNRKNLVSASLNSKTLIIDSSLLVSSKAAYLFRLIIRTRLFGDLGM
jgi:hypothetical protein